MANLSGSGPSSGSILDAAQSYELMDLVSMGVAYAIIIAAFLAVVFIFIGGFSFILSGGQEDKIKSAVSTIRYAIIGLIVALFAVVIVQAVGAGLGLDIVQYLNFGDILETISNIVSGDGGRGRSLD